MITVYSQPSCGPCVVTEAYLRKAGLPFDKVMITQDEHAADLVKSLGHERTPVVVVEEDGKVINHWSGFSETRLKALAES